jgi:hypothetical protein
MTIRSDATTAPVSTTSPGTVTADASRLYQEGMIGGVLAAVAVAVWFFVVDLLHGRPLYTPTVLGTALFRHGAGLTSPEALPISPEMVLMFSWVHGLVFAAIGGVAARLLGVAERNPNLGFGILLLFVVFQAGFTVVVLLVAQPVLQALTWPAILVANVLAAATMGLYLWLRHPDLRVSP